MDTAWKFNGGQNAVGIRFLDESKLIETYRFGSMVDIPGHNKRRSKISWRLNSLEQLFSTDAKQMGHAFLKTLVGHYEFQSSMEVVSRSIDDHSTLDWYRSWSGPGRELGKVCLLIMFTVS